MTREENDEVQARPEQQSQATGLTSQTLPAQKAVAVKEEGTSLGTDGQGSQAMTRVTAVKEEQVGQAVEPQAHAECAMDIARVFHCQ